MADPNGPGGTWNLVFEDTFPGTSLNTAYWQIGTGTVNNVQCFASNVIVNNGLTLQLANSNSGAEIFTHDAYNLPVGSVAEARIWFPGPGGTPGTSIYNWPAWWVSGPSWPNAGEIDIAEGLGTLTVNYHGPGSSSYNTGTVTGNWSNSWHTYTVRRNAHSFDIWYDGVLVRSSQPTADNGQPQNMILNVGAANTAAYGTSSYMLVSYVRQWAPASSGGGTPVSNVNVDFTTNVAATDPLGAGFVISEFGGNPIPFLTNNGNWNTTLANLGAGHMRASLAWYGGNPSYGAGGSPGQQGSGGSVAKALVGAIKAAGAVPLISFNGNSNDNNFQPADGASLVHFFNDSGGQNNGRVQYWSIGNEPEFSGGTWNTTTYQAGSGQGSAPATLSAMLGADSSINVGIPTAGHWNPGLLSWAAGVSGIGTLSYHAYDGANTDDTSSGAGPFPSGRQLYNHVKNDLPGMKAGISYGVEEMNWHSSYSGMTQFNDWHDTCFIADNLGQVLSAGGHATVYSDSNGGLGLLNDNQGQGQLGTYGSPQPAYWGIGVWTGMAGQFKKYSGHFVSASSTFSTSTLAVYACDNGKIVVVNKDGGSAHALTIGMTLAGGITTGTYNVWATNQGSPGSAIAKVVNGASFSGSSITYTVPAGTAVSIDITPGAPVKNLTGNAGLAGSGHLAASGIAPGSGLPANNFAGGTNGAAITPLNSGGISGSAFDAVSVVAGGVAQFSATQAIHSPLSGAFSTGTTSGVSVVEWLAASVGTQTTVFGRAYVRLTGNPSSDDNIMAFYGGSGTFAGGIMIAGSGQLRLQNATFGEVGGGPIMPLNQWFRLEWQFICGPAGSATGTVQYFSSADSTVVTSSLVDNAGQFGVGGSVNEAHWGWTSSHPNQPLMYQANIGLSNTGHLGPVSSAHPAAAAMGGTGTLSASTPVPVLLALLSGTGTLTAGQGAVRPAAAPLSGTGKLTAAFTQGPFSATASMGVAGLVIKPAAAAFSAGTSMSVTATVPLMIARPVLSATALVTERASASFTAPGSLSATTSQSAAHFSGAAKLIAPGRAGAARMLAGTSLTASGQYFMPGQAALYGGAVLSAAGKTTEVAAAHLSASTALAASVLARVAGTSSLSAPGHLAAAAQAVAVPLSAAAHLSATATRTAKAAAALHAAPSVTPAAKVTERAAAALHAAAVLSPPGKVTRFARVSLAAPAALRAPGVRITRGQSALSAAAVLHAAGRHIAVAPVALSAAPVLHAAGTVVPGTRLSASPSLAASGKLSRAGHAAFSAGARLAVTAKGTTFPGAALTAVSTLAPTSLAIAEGRTALAVSPSLAALAGTRPGVPFPVRSKGQQPTWQRDVQGFAIRQERQRHAQALWQFGELAVFCLLWRPLDIEAGLAQRCTRCYTPAAVIPVTPAQPDSSAAAEAQISAAYGQGSQFRCPLCYGTQLIAAKTAKVPGVRALLVRPAILTDTDQNQQRSAKGVVNTGSVQVQSTPDFRVHTLDYFFRSDGRRYQLQVPARTTLRTGFATPWQAAAGISYNLAGASLEDPKASVAYIIPPSEADLARVLGTYTRVPADYAWFEQVNGPLIPEETPPRAASGSYQPPASLLR